MSALSLGLVTEVELDRSGWTTLHATAMRRDSTSVLHNHGEFITVITTKTCQSAVVRVHSQTSYSLCVSKTSFIYEAIVQILTFKQRTASVSQFSFTQCLFSIRLHVIHSRR